MFIESSAILGASPSRQRIEQFHEARLVRITHGGAAIWLDPFGMLDPQVVVKLLPELGVGVDFVRHGNWLIWNVSSVLSSSVAIAFKWRGLAPWRHRLLRIVVRIAWPWCLVRRNTEP